MLRLGILLTSSAERHSELSAWVVALLRRLQQMPALTIAIVGICPASNIAEPSVLSSRYWSNRAFHWYRKWDQRRSGLTRDAQAQVPWQDALDGAPLVTLDRDPAAWASYLGEFDLDVLLWLDPTQFRHIPGIARLGTWLLDVAENWGQPAVPALWHEHTHGAAVITRLLSFTEPASTPQVVYETTTAVDPFSFAKSSNPVYWKSTEIIARSLSRLLREGSAMSLTSAAKPQKPKRPASLAMSRFLWNEVLRRVRSRSKRSQQATFAKWCMGLRTRTASTRFNEATHYRLMVSPRDRFYADPFLFEHDGRTWLFFEDFRYAEGRAVISCCEVNSSGELQEPFEVLRLPHHLSYPFIFQHDGVLYMIPESRGNRTVSMYRAVNFPYAWQHDTDLFTEVDMVDTTLHLDEGRWWLFAGVSNGDYSNSDELCIYYADELRGPWTAHAQNPVISDVRRARPAGRLFRDNGRLIRPSQDCGPAYGYGLVFSEVEELTPESYRERVLAELTPESIPGNTANHTYTRTAGFEVIDRFFIESRLGEAETFATNKSPSGTLENRSGEKTRR